MKNDFITVIDGIRKINLPVDRIKYVHAKGAYCALFMIEGRQYMKSWNIGRVEKYLKHTCLYFRSHESALVNQLCVNWQEFPTRSTLPMIDGTQQLFAKRRKNEYKKLRRKMTAGK